MKCIAALVNFFTVIATCLAETPAKEGQAHWNYLGHREITSAGSPKANGVVLGQFTLVLNFVQQTWTIDEVPGVSPKLNGLAIMSYDALKRVYRMSRYLSDGTCDSGDGVWEEAGQTLTWTLKDPVNGQTTVVKSIFGKDESESWEQTTKKSDGKVAGTMHGKNTRGGWPQDPPAVVMEKHGSFAISDGASWYSFSKDGSFKSGPMGMSGRTFEGKWTLSDEMMFTVIAKVGWYNGGVPRDDYRRIVFRISRPAKRPEMAAVRMGGAPDLFDANWYIEEMVKVPKPE
jgi:hypothetical protein